MISYTKKLGFSLGTLALSLGLAFSFHTEKISTLNAYPDIIARTLPFETNINTHTADFLSNKKINAYSGEIPENIQEMMNHSDFNPDEIEPGIVKATVDRNSMNTLGEMIQNHQLTLNDLYNDISPVFGEAVKNNEINWDWNGYTMEYTFLVAEGDELFWKIYFSHPTETLFFHEALVDVRFVPKENAIHDTAPIENKREYTELNTTEKFRYLAHNTTSLYTDTLLNIFEKYEHAPIREDNLNIQLNSQFIGNIATSLDIKNNFPTNSSDVKINIDGNIASDKISAEVNIRKIKNDIFAILNTYEYASSTEKNELKNLKNITNQWYQLNNPDISEIARLFLNEKIQADLLTFGKDILILAKDLILTTDIVIVDEYLGVNEESGYEEFSVKINEKYIAFLSTVLHNFSPKEITEIQEYLQNLQVQMEFDKNNSKYFIIKIKGYKIAYTHSGLDIYIKTYLEDRNIPSILENNYPQHEEDYIHFHADKNTVYIKEILNEELQELLNITISDNKISGYITDYHISPKNISKIDLTQNNNQWSGEITSDINTGKVIIENCIFDTHSLSGEIHAMQNGNNFGTVSIDFSTSYPITLEIENPAENKENRIKSFKELDSDVNKKNYNTAPVNQGYITQPKNPENYAGSFYNGNYVWGGAMNLAWTDLSENIIQEKIALDLETSETEAQKIVEKLNNPVMTKEDLSEENYYIKSGYGQETVDAINKESKEKFPSKSFDDLDIQLSPKDIIAYAYFLKEIEYKIPFTISKYAFFFKDESEGVKSFYAKNTKQKENVNIIHYENDDKFIVSLRLKDNSDNLILAKGYDMNSPEKVVTEMQNIMQNQETFETLQEDDSFQMPFLHVDMTRTYTELMNKFFTNTNFETYFIAQMFENIKFDMNEKGARVENEAVIAMIDNVAFDEENKYIPKRIILDDDFWVIMKQNNSLNPYFLLGVQNEDVMKKFEKNIDIQ